MVAAVPLDVELLTSLRATNVPGEFNLLHNTDGEAQVQWTHRDFVMLVACVPLKLLEGTGVRYMRDTIACACWRQLWNNPAPPVATMATVRQ